MLLMENWTDHIGKVRRQMEMRIPELKLMQTFPHPNGLEA